MSVSFLLQNLSGFTRARAAAPAAAAPLPRVQGVDDGRQDQVDARNELTDLFLAIESLAESLDVRTQRFRLDLPDARSNPALALNLSESAAFLASAEEINASPNSFSPFGPDWALGSSSLLTLSGAYDGSNGTGALSFEARRGGIRGVDNLRIRVRDPLGGIIGNYAFRRRDPIDQPVDLGNGLFLTLGTGALIVGDTASVNVFQGVGSRVDPDKPLAGTRNDDPNFQYYPAPDTLPGIVDGSFDINGETIGVSTTDTINSVIDRINGSAAGVTAVFDPGSERIELTQQTVGSAPDIAVANDTSNFTLATKLADAVVTPGTDSEARAAFADVDYFGGVTSGDIRINGTDIAIDTAADGLEGVIDKINASGAGVTAQFDAASQVVSIESVDGQSSLELDGNGTGLFAALNIPEGRVDPEVARGGLSARRAYRIADALADVSERINRLFDAAALSPGARAALRGVRAGITAAFSGALSENASFGEGRFGITLSAGATSANGGNVFEIDRRRVTRWLQTGGEQIRELLVGKRDAAGLVERLRGTTTQALQQVNSRLGITGSLIDTFA